MHFHNNLHKKNSKIHFYEKKIWAKKHAILFYNNTVGLFYLVCAQKGESTLGGSQNCCHIVLFFKGPMFELQPCHYYEKNSQCFAHYGRSKPKKIKFYINYIF
jgi:hypothetical protein